MRKKPEVTTVPKNDREFYELYKDQVAARVRKLNAGQVSRQEMDDIIQGVWCRLIEYGTLTKYETARGTFPAFLNTAVYNASWNIRRTRRNRSRGEVLLKASPTEENDDISFWNDVVLTDNGAGANNTSAQVDLEGLDARLAEYLSAEERSTLYAAVQEGGEIEETLMSFGLDCMTLEAIFEEAL